MSKQLLILLSGHNASGKSVLSKELISELNINQVNGDVIRDMLISNIKFYSDTHYSYPNEKIISANKVMSVFRMDLVKELLFKDQSVLIDGAGITKEARNNYLKLAGHYNKEIVTIIIEAILDEDELLNRLKNRDSKNSQYRWVDLYLDIRKEKYESVEDSEADLVLRYDQNNSREIIQAIKKIEISM
ncbi:MAG: AAA family ATPase [Candidatus Pacebacteria bacterium]|nr:AAA family ATPase [Candidatus Paceibacterota bacterium]